MSIIKKYPKLGSSQDPDKLSLTIKGLLLALVPVIITISQAYNLPITESDLVSLVNNLVAIVSAAVVIYGIVRKFKRV